VNPERYRRSKEIAERALEMPPTEREAFLDEACGEDTILRRETAGWIAQCEASSPIGASPAELDSEVAGAFDLQPGTVLMDRYEVEVKLGMGGMGSVYRARDLRFRNTVAVKHALLDAPEWLVAFEREARLLRNLKHRALPRVIDYFGDGGAWYLVMDFVPGEDLAKTMRRTGSAFRPDQVAEWGEQVLAVLEYLHGHEPPIVHRDIKPGNLKLTPSGEVILLDFGLAKGSAANMSKVTSGGSIPAYTAPYAPFEQVSGQGTDPRADLYSLGATIYHLMTGVLPPRSSVRAFAASVGAPDPMRPARELNPRIPKALSRVLDAAMSTNPSQRPRSAAEMRELLREAARYIHP
jgi:eukaryotic-like serine/threonine-protein kinase